MSTWSLVFDSHDPDREGHREALCTLANGYFATRGAAEESTADGAHYPGCYLAGGYNRLQSEILGQWIENEDLVNLPNWLVLRFRTEGSDWLDLGRCDIVDFRQELDLKRGVLRRLVRLRDSAGRTTQIRSWRLVHMSLPHVAVLRSEVTAEDWSGPIEVFAALDGQVQNVGVARYRQLSSRHLQSVAAQQVDGETIALAVRTVQSRLTVALAHRFRAFLLGDGIAPERALVGPPSESIGQQFTVQLARGQPVAFEKVVTLFTSRDMAISEPLQAAIDSAAALPDAQALLVSHTQGLRRLWRRFPLDVEISDTTHSQRALLALRLHAFHLMQVGSPNTVDLDVGLPARGLHGEAYRGHIFWDEITMFPVLNLALPEVTRARLLYRYRRLTPARKAAAAEGLRGALFPWQSASDGREETQRLHLNPRSGRWNRDRTHLQRHVNAAIAYSTWKYWETAADSEFLSRYGAEILLEVARLWSSLSRYIPERQRYEIHGVMGPDEYHDAYPEASEPGLKNNAYTNAMAAWCIARALDALGLLPSWRRQELVEQLQITTDELDRFADLTRRMHIPLGPDGIIQQFEDYAALEEFDWEGYRRKYGRINRLDRILEAEGDTVNRYQASKQADVVMLFYLLSPDEQTALFEGLGVGWDSSLIRKNIAYYLARSSHGSTLSRVVHAGALARLDPDRAYIEWIQSLDCDLQDVQGGTTSEGIHLGAMAGTVDVLQRGFVGLEPRGNILHFAPSLPTPVLRISFGVHYRGHSLRVTVTADELVVRSEPSRAPPLGVAYGGQTHALGSGAEIRVPLAQRAAD